MKAFLTRLINRLRSSWRSENRRYTQTSENRFSAWIDGKLKHFEAFESNTCGNCEAREPICRLNLRHPHCTAARRSDNRYVSWREAEPEPVAPTPYDERIP